MKPARPADRMYWAACQEGVPSRAVRVLVLLAYRDGPGGCSPSNAMLMKEAGLSERGLQRALSDLKRLKIIRREQVGRYGSAFVVDYGRVGATLSDTPEEPQGVTPNDTPENRGATVSDAPRGVTVSDAEGRQSVTPRGDSFGPPRDLRTGRGTGRGTGRLMSDESDTPSQILLTGDKHRVDVDLERLWAELMRLYVDSGHGPKPLDLEAAERRDKLMKVCVRLGGKKNTRHGGVMVRHLLAFWLYGDGDFYRMNRKGSELIASLLRHTEVSNRYTESDSWEYDDSPPEVQESKGWVLNTKKDIARALENGLGAKLAEWDARGWDFGMQKNSLERLCSGRWAKKFKAVEAEWKRQCIKT